VVIELADVLRSTETQRAGPTPLQIAFGTYSFDNYYLINFSFIDYLIPCVSLLARPGGHAIDP
jgi:hypothetical protein